MTLAQLLAEFRVDADDRTAGYLFADVDITRWLNEAQEEACLRADLLFESSDEEMCAVYVYPQERSYALDDRWTRITQAFMPVDGTTRELRLTSREELDRTQPGWRNHTNPPTALMLFDTRVELDSYTTAPVALMLEGFRLPLAPMMAATDTPEIGRTHHRRLVDWALYRGYSVPDSEVFNPDKAAKALAVFTQIFGSRPDADLRKQREVDVPHANVAIW